MARHYITSKGESKAYTPKQQKQLTMQALGLDPASPEDNRTYKSIYDDLARRTRQYNILQDLSENSKLKPADVLFDIAHDRQRQGVTEAPTLNSIQTIIRQRGTGYSPTVQNLYNQTLQANTARYAARVRETPDIVLNQAIQNEINVFSSFLNTKRVDHDKADFNIWLDTPVYLNTTTGEYIPLDKIDESEFAFYELTDRRRRDIVRITEVRAKLEELAATRKERYRRIYTDRENNVYHYEVRQA